MLNAPFSYQLAGGRLRGGAVQGQPGGGVPPRGRRQGRRRALDAVRRRRVQPRRDRLPPPGLLRGQRRPEVQLCGHATLASAHFLFASVLAEHETLIEFSTKSGILTAKKVPAPERAGVSGEGKRFIELDLPRIDLVDCHPSELPSIPETLNGASIVSVHKSTIGDIIIVELSSGKEVADIIPNIHEIKICSGRGIIVTGPAPAGSDFDFFTRFFCPKYGVDEDQVCGSAHCVLAPYWGGKLGKHKLTAFQASPRSGILYLELEAAGRRVRIQGEAVSVMTGTLLA